MLLLNSQTCFKFVGDCLPDIQKYLILIHLVTLILIYRKLTSSCKIIINLKVIDIFAL